MATIREYTVTQTTYSGHTVAWVRNRDNDPSILRFSPIPTLEEARAVLGSQIEGLYLWGCFNPNGYVKAFPKVPPGDTILNLSSMFSACEAMEVAPAMPDFDDYDAFFHYCINLKVPAVVPKVAQKIGQLYDGCTSLTSLVSIPKNVTQLDEMYDDCPNAGGEMILRIASYPSGWRGEHFLRDTVKPITIYGDQAVCEAAAATANNHNASWSPWYDPVPAVTNRGQGSYTTADDMTRMVRNGALAVNTYAPGRMRYQQGDIVREDEWIALVEAAQTIDPTITLSTHYSNLNKIEAAFDSAL